MSRTESKMYRSTCAACGFWSKRGAANPRFTKKLAFALHQTAEHGEKCAPRGHGSLSPAFGIAYILGGVLWKLTNLTGLRPPSNISRRPKSIRHSSGWSIE